MPHTWEEALSKYRYPDRRDRRLDLARFKDAKMYPGWFDWSTDEGNLTNTKAFEARFREHGPHSLKAWAEVTFWKLYTFGLSRDKTTRQVLASDVTPGDLWQRCANYIEKRSPQSFRDFRATLFQEPVVATAATFPAFICPDEFPMVDKHVTEWARTEGKNHSYSAIGGPSFSWVPELGKGVLLESHWPFVESWIEWCQFTASRLYELTGSYWRARDVEMAVFTAQGSQRYRNPWDRLTLNPLT